MKNAQQINGVISATFPAFDDAAFSRDCSILLNNVDELACSWRLLNTHLKKFGGNEDILDDKLLVSISNVRLRVVLSYNPLTEIVDERGSGVDAWYS